MGIAGAAGIGGGAIAGTDGIDGEGKPSAGELGAACFAAPRGLTGCLREMTCVYALGPLGVTGWLGGGSLAGRLNALVAPSEAEPARGVPGGFSIAGLGGCGVGKAGGGGGGNTGVGTEMTGVGATYGTGCGGAKGSFGAAGKTGGSSKTDRGNPLVGGVPLVPGVRDARFGLLNHPVNPVPGDSFPATPDAGNGSSRRGGLNIAVNSPTFFRGGSICCGDPDGVCGGPSTRNGP